MKLNVWHAGVVFLCGLPLCVPALADPKDSGKWQLVSEDGRGQKTYMDTRHFQAGKPASFLVKTDLVQCQSKYRMHTCTKIVLFDADCQKGQIKYVRDMTRDAIGDVVKEWDNARAKMVYPPPGTSLETLLIRACQHNKKLL